MSCYNKFFNLIRRWCLSTIATRVTPTILTTLSPMSYHFRLPPTLHFKNNPDVKFKDICQTLYSTRLYTCSLENKSTSGYPHWDERKLSNFYLILIRRDFENTSFWFHCYWNDLLLKDSLLCCLLTPFVAHDSIFILLFTWNSHLFCCSFCTDTLQPQIPYNSWRNPPNLYKQVPFNINFKVMWFYQSFKAFIMFFLRC